MPVSLTLLAYKTSPLETIVDCCEAFDDRSPREVFHALEAEPTFAEKIAVKVIAFSRSFDRETTLFVGTFLNNTPILLGESDIHRKDKRLILRPLPIETLGNKDKDGYRSFVCGGVPTVPGQIGEPQVREVFAGESQQACEAFLDCFIPGEVSLSFCLNALGKNLHTAENFFTSDTRHA